LALCANEAPACLDWTNTASVHRKIIAVNADIKLTIMPLLHKTRTHKFFGGTLPKESLGDFPVKM